ncbi:YbaN family protein [Variovorax sp. GT1P44]|uniref:YbaN family protein n=1 Tax=Variovorax sp. GT1P44 TaxID=3443742 RepID=UPI003F457856
MIHLRAVFALFLWRTLAVVCLLLGVIGIFLPVMPTVPFVLVAAWAAGRGWPALESWLLGHPRYGVHVRQWRQGGFMPRRAKWGASIGMMGSAILFQFLPVPQAARMAVPLCMALVAAWLWLRPEPPSAAVEARDARRGTSAARPEKAPNSWHQFDSSGSRLQGCQHWLPIGRRPGQLPAPASQRGVVLNDRETRALLGPTAVQATPASRDARSSTLSSGERM